MTQFKTDLLAMMDRLTLTEHRAAGLLGVPVYTLRKWIAGQRAPNAAAVHLLAVLGTLEALAPNVLAALIPPDPVATKKQKKNVHVGKVPSNP